MPSPPGTCDHCGWKGPAVAYSGNASTDITYVGSMFPCPVCDKPARVVDGVYDFIGDAVRVVRNAEWSIDEMQAMIDAARTGASRDALASGHPELTRIIELLEQSSHAPSFDWRAALTAFLVAILTVLATPVATELETPPAKVTTVQLSDQSVREIAQEFHREWSADTKSPPGRADRKPTAQKRKKQPKTYGRDKRRRR